MGSDRYLESRNNPEPRGPLSEVALATELRNRFITKDDCPKCHNTGRVELGFDMSSPVLDCNYCGRGLTLDAILQQLEEGKAPPRKFWKVRMGVMREDLEMTATYPHIKAGTAQEAEAIATAAATKEFNVAIQYWQIEATEEEK